MEELTESFPTVEENEASPSSYQYTITFDIPTSIIAVLVFVMFLRLLYHIFSGLFFFWIAAHSSWRDDQFDQEGIMIPADYTFSDVFQVLVQHNLQAWTTELIKQNIDEKRGQKLRDSKRLPPLVNYGGHEGVINYADDCAICLEGFEVGEFCQAFSVCSHIFHSKCIDRWLARNLTCPICRSSVVG